MNLKQLREKAGLRQEDVAKELGINRSTVAKWELGVAHPRVTKFSALADLFHCTIDDLFREEESDNAEVG